MDTEVCKETIIHKEKVDMVKRKLNGQDFSSLLALGKCFGDSSRIKIFYALETFKEMCVCDLASVLNTSIAATSHHLRFLKKYGLTKSRQNGKVVYYSLSNEEVVTTIHAFLTISENVGVKS